VEGEQLLHCDWRERNCYTVTGGRGRVILGLEGEEGLYWDLRERNRITGTGGIGTIILGLV